MGLRARELVVIVSVCGAALAGTVAAVSGRGADDDFLLRQENPVRLDTESVEKLMLDSPDPDPPHEPSGTRARCAALGERDLRNPWRCTVRYRSGSVARYRVTINPDGSYFARYSGGTATARGRCVEIPGAGG